jgi:hypothetical protein
VPRTGGSIPPPNAAFTAIRFADLNLDDANCGVDGRNFPRVRTLGSRASWMIREPA